MSSNSTPVCSPEECDAPTDLHTAPTMSGIDAVSEIDVASEVDAGCVHCVHLIRQRLPSLVYSGQNITYTCHLKVHPTESVSDDPGAPTANPFVERFLAVGSACNYRKRSDVVTPALAPGSRLPPAPPFRDCSTCLFLAKSDVGYSNYSTEGTTADCVLKCNPSLPTDNWYGHAQEFGFGLQCQHRFPGKGAHFDVDHDNGDTENYSTDPVLTPILVVWKDITPPISQAPDGASFQELYMHHMQYAPMLGQSAHHRAHLMRDAPKRRLAALAAEATALVEVSDPMADVPKRPMDYAAVLRRIQKHARARYTAGTITLPQLLSIRDRVRVLHTRAHQLHTARTARSYAVLQADRWATLYKTATTPPYSWCTGLSPATLVAIDIGFDRDRNGPVRDLSMAIYHTVEGQAPKLRVHSIVAEEEPDHAERVVRAQALGTVKVMPRAELLVRAQAACVQVGFVCVHTASAVFPRLGIDLEPEHMVDLADPDVLYGPQVGMATLRKMYALPQPLVRSPAADALDILEIALRRVLSAPTISV